MLRVRNIDRTLFSGKRLHHLLGADQGFRCWQTGSPLTQSVTGEGTLEARHRGTNRDGL